ncbi:MAG TPA: zf-HC2 domain-containing protein [Pyrinomonadaceae bacterium]|nr:zf-HC2 domain-containing protein [Pyrinomonadaceae bacterium]
MKEANNNAIDLLLRSLARGDRDDSWAETDSISRLGGDSGTASDHLDADELSLYAEGVLAPPARIRYTEHLADCQRCRTLVVGLAQSAGRTFEPETKKQSGTSFWASLGALFSIPVLRYAIPAVLLTGVLAIGLLALRDRNASELVAVKQQTDLAAPNVQSAANSEIPQPGATPPIQEMQLNDAGEPPRPAAKISAGDAGLVTDGTDSSAAKGRIENEGKDAAPEVRGQAGVQPVYAPDPVSAPAPPPKVAEVSESRAEKKKDDYLERELAKRNQDELKLSSPKDDSPAHGPSRSRTLSGGSRRDEDVTLQDRAATQRAKKEAPEETDTLTISGRKFQRRGNAWIDTAFSSARSVTNVGRGTEHFRSLMADEPGLRAIVQQLGGEVLVVWKNRAYRIR